MPNATRALADTARRFDLELMVLSAVVVRDVHRRDSPVTPIVTTTGVFLKHIGYQESLDWL